MSGEIRFPNQQVYEKFDMCILSDFPAFSDGFLKPNYHIFNLNTQVHFLQILERNVYVKLSFYSQVLKCSNNFLDGTDPARISCQ